MRPSVIDDVVRSADPVSRQQVAAWRASAGAAAIRIRSNAEPSDAPTNVDTVSPTRRRRRVSSVALAAAIILALGATVGAAAVLLGEPAPPAVKKDLARVDAGYPADLRFNPDVASARSVATTGASTLYYAQLKDGGHCSELVTGGTARGAVCTPASALASQPIEITIPFTDPVTATSPVTIGGHVNAADVTAVELRYTDGGTDPITLGDDGFFVFDVPADRLASVHDSDFAVVGLGSDGQEVANVSIPAIGEEPETPPEDTAAITVDTISDGSDLTKVLGVRGKVNAEGAESLEFEYPDGTTVSVPIAKDGSYSFDIPVDRQVDLFGAPGTLTALDANGKKVASVPVAAVAWWRAHPTQG